MFSIGTYTLASKVLLAPMAGVSDLPFRQLCQRYGAGLTTSEMLTSDSRLWGSVKSQTRLKKDEHSTVPNSIQIVGHDPAMLADAANKAVDLGADIIDINMGCPAKKVCRKAAGSALLKDEALVETILTAVVNKLNPRNIPVTLKIRTGWNIENRNATRIAIIAEQAGIQALTVHGRTRACRFNGTAEFDTIAQVKAAVSIPVIANGDITSAIKACDILSYTQADAVMVGRGAQGQPWLIQQINQALAGDAVIEPSLAEKLQQLNWHVNALHQFYGEFMGLRIARKHTGWYFDKMAMENHKKSFNRLESAEQQMDFLHQINTDIREQN